MTWDDFVAKYKPVTKPSGSLLWYAGDPEFDTAPAWWSVPQSFEIMDILKECV